MGRSGIGVSVGHTSHLLEALVGGVRHKFSGFRDLVDEVG